MKENKIIAWLNNRLLTFILSGIFIYHGLDVYYSGGTYLGGVSINPAMGLGISFIGLCAFLFAVIKKS